VEKNEIELRIDGLSDEALKDLETRRTGIPSTSNCTSTTDGEIPFRSLLVTVPTEINLDLGTSGGTSRWRT